MSRMIKRLMVVLVAMFMFVGMVTTPVQAKPGKGNGKGHGGKAEPEPTVETTEPENSEVSEETPVAEETIVTEEPAAEETVTDETVAEEVTVEEVEEVETTEIQPAEEPVETEVDESAFEAVDFDVTEISEEPAEDSVFTAEAYAPRVLAVPQAYSLTELPDEVFPDGSSEDEATVPKIAKKLSENGDGTYTIGLSVTGDADTTVEEAGNVNVLIIYDHSSSMASNASGTRYSRADQAEDVVYDFVHSLFSYQSSKNPSNIQVSLVRFARTADETINWTSSENDITRYFDDNGTDGRTNQNYSSNQNANNGTNWQSALNAAGTLLQRADTDPTFVIFVTDGAPTASGNGNNAINPAGARLDELVGFYRAACENARNIQTRANTTLFGIYCYGTEADLLDDLIYYSNVGAHRPNVTGDTVLTENYFNAGNTAQLSEAIDSIFSQIVNALGVAAVSIHDGTTNQVTTTSGEISEMLEVDETTYKYWISIPYVNNQFTRIDLVSGEEITYTLRNNGDETVTVTWGSNSVTLPGTMNNNVFRYEWTTANSLYNYAPPAAKMTNGTVDWDLSSVGTLLNGVTYTVTFECYPSQYTLDLIADLENEYIQYSDLDDEERKYLSDDYKLSTNTTASMTYTDTRTDEGQKSKTYTNPDPEKVTAAKQLVVSKKWSNTLDNRDNWKTATIDLLVTRDGEERYTVKLNGDNDWTDDVFISYGILTSHDNALTLKTTGHDYSFAETAEVGHNWEIEAPTVRPMLINAVETMLVKIEGSEAPDELTSSTKENDTFTNGDDTYYKLTIENDTGEKNIEYYIVGDVAGSLTATNHRRSYLDVVKQVTGNVPDNTEFEFKMTVKTNAENPDADDTASDAWVWFSIWDTSKNEAVKNPDAATANGLKWEIGEGDNAEVVDTKPAVSAFNGYFLVPTGNEITVAMKAGYSLRFLNLPVGAEYTVKETDDSEFATFESIVGERTFDEDGKEETPDDKITEPAGSALPDQPIISGTIEYYESAYKVTVANTANAFYVYHSSDNTIEKVQMSDQRVTLEEDGTYRFDIIKETKKDFFYGGYYKGYGQTESSDEDIRKLNYTQSDSKQYEYAVKLASLNNWATDPNGKPYNGPIDNGNNTDIWNMNDEDTGAYTTESGDSMRPVANTVYYLKEVPDAYLEPATYVVYDTHDVVDNCMQVKKLYLMSLTDDGNYKSVGFDVTLSANLTKKNIDGGQKKAEWWSTKIDVNKLGNTIDTLYATSIQENYHGLIFANDVKEYILSNAYYREIPYWITPDEVKVTGKKQMVVMLKTTRFNEWNKPGMTKSALAKTPAYRPINSDEYDEKQVD